MPWALQKNSALQGKFTFYRPHVSRDCDWMMLIDWVNCGSAAFSYFKESNSTS